MDNYLFDCIYERVPQFNRTVAEGIAVRDMRGVERYVDHIFKCAQESFPEGMRYDGYKRCSPKAEYAEITKKRNNTQAYELARSDVYMAEYGFSLHGKPLISQKLYLPYVGEAGEIHIRGSSFFVYPVLADKTISVGVNSLFLPFNRDKLTFERLSHSYTVDDKQESEYVYWSAIHHALNAPLKGSSATMPSDLRTPLFLYLFCQYGVTETFRRVCGEDVIIGHAKDVNDETYPDYQICRSNGMRPPNMKVPYYKGSDIQIAVRTPNFTPAISSLIATFYYIVDYFPQRVTVEDLDEPRLWKIILGQIIFKNKNNLGKLVEGIDAHLNSLDGYMDAMMRETLAQDGIPSRDIYELFLYIIEKFSSLIINSDISSMYGKRFTVLRYMLFDITKAISTLVFKLQSLPPAKRTEKDINLALSRTLKTELIFGIVGHKHGEVSGVSYPGDNKIFKITSNVVLQGDATPGAKSKKSANLADPARFLHSSVVEVGSYSNQPKSEPTGRTRANPRVNIAGDGSIIRDPVRADILDEFQAKIARK